MSEQGIAVVALVPVNRHITPVFGSTIITADCGHYCFVAACSLEFREKEKKMKVLFVCNDCLPDNLITNPSVDKYLIPGSTDELTQALGVAESDQLLAFAKEVGFKEDWPDECGVHSAKDDGWPAEDPEARDQR